MSEKDVKEVIESELKILINVNLSNGTGSSNEFYRYRAWGIFDCLYELGLITYNEDCNYKDIARRFTDDVQ